MATSVAHVLAQMQRWIGDRTSDITDQILLERYVHQRDEAAFTALVARYGALVLRVCRRILGDSHRAEDAFQATFVILARKAHSLRHPEALVGWLHGVARRVALKARGKANSRSFSVTPLDKALPDPCPDPLAQVSARELLALVDEQVQRLPAAQRSVIVLCCLEGHTREEAARQLGWTPSAVKSHLQRGRQRLQERLARRGIALSAALPLVAVARCEAVLPSLLHNTVKAALDGGSGSTVSALAYSVLRALLWRKFAGVMTVVLTLALAASTTVALVYRGLAAEAPEDGKPAVLPTPKAADEGKSKVRTDALGDPLPDGAIRRLGTQRFRYGWGMNNLLLTPDGKTLISNEAAGTVSVWELATGKLLHQFPGNLHNQRYIALSPDGKRVAVGYSKAIVLWDLATGKEVRRLAQPNATGVAFSPDGKTLAAASNGADKDGIQLWDLSTGTKIAKLPWERGNHYSSVLIAYTPDGKTVIAGQWFDSKVGLWDVASGKKRQELDAKAGAILSLTLSPDGSLLATGCRQGGAYLWDVRTGQLIRKFLAEEGKEPIESVAFSPDGRKLAAIESESVKSDGRGRSGIHIWDVRSGKELSRLKGGSGLQNIVYSRDGKTLIVASLGAIRLLDAATWKEVGRTAGCLDYLGFTRCSGIGSADGSTLPYLRQCDVRSWEAKQKQDVSSVEIRFWDMKENREISSSIEFDCFWGCITFALTPDGRTISVSDALNTINLWDVRSGKLIRRLQQGKNERLDAHALAFSSDGRMLASADTKAAGIRLWDGATGKQIRWLPLMKATAAQEGSNWRGVCGIAFSSDERLLAASGITWAAGSGVRIWEVATGKELSHLTRTMNTPNREDTPDVPLGFGPYKMIVPNVAFSPHGTMLAKNGRPKTIPIWEAVTGRQRLFLKGHEDSTVCVAFAPDSRTLASASWDSTIRLWDLRTGRELRKLTGHRGKANALAFSTDGKTLVSCGDDTTILFWDVADVTLRKNPLPETIGKHEWQALWEDLAKDDAAKAYAAMVRMASDGATTIVALKERLRPLRPADPARVARLLKELDSEEFAVREAANRELEELGDLVKPAVQQALTRPGLPLELRRRLEAIAATLEELSGDHLRQVRAVEVLHMLGMAEGRELLEKVATGAPEARLTEQAKAALGQLANRRDNRSR